MIRERARALGRGRGGTSLPRRVDQTRTRVYGRCRRALEPLGALNKCGFGGLTFDMSGGAKGAKRPLGRPLDGGVRRSLLESSQVRKRRRWSKPGQPASPVGGRAVCQSVLERHDHQARLEQRAHVQLSTSTIEGAPLERRAVPKTTESLNCDSTRGL